MSDQKIPAISGGEIAGLEIVVRTAKIVGGEASYSIPIRVAQVESLIAAAKEAERLRGLVDTIRAEHNRGGKCHCSWCEALAAGGSRG